MEIGGSFCVCECMARTISRRKIIRCRCMIKQIVRIVTTRSSRLNHIDLVIAQFAHRADKLSLLKTCDGNITICFIYLIRTRNTFYIISQSVIAHWHVAKCISRIDFCTIVVLGFSFIMANDGSLRINQVYTKDFQTMVATGIIKFYGNCCIRSPVKNSLGISIGGSQRGCNAIR